MENKITLMLFPLKIFNTDIFSGYIIPMVIYMICEFEYKLTEQDFKLIILVVLCFAAGMFCFNRIKRDIKEKIANKLYESYMSNPSNNIKVIHDDKYSVLAFLFNETERENFDKFSFFNPEKVYMAIESVGIIDDLLFPIVMFVTLLSSNLFAMIISIVIIRIMKMMIAKNSGLEDIKS